MIVKKDKGVDIFKAEANQNEGGLDMVSGSNDKDIYRILISSVAQFTRKTEEVSD